MGIYIPVYIYIYIERERERESEDLHQSIFVQRTRYIFGNLCTVLILNRDIAIILMNNTLNINKVNHFNIHTLIKFSICLSISKN